MSRSNALLLASRTLVDLLCRRAESPGRGVAIFSPSGELHEETLSMEALERRARAIGAALHAAAAPLIAELARRHLVTPPESSP